MFSAEAVKKAEAQLDRVEKATHIPTVIETLEALPEGGSAAEKKRAAIDALGSAAVTRRSGMRGIYLLISKDDHLILARPGSASDSRISFLPIEKRDAIRDAFIEGFKKRDFDGGLSHGVQVIERALEGASAGHKAAAHAAQGGYPSAATKASGRTVHHGNVPARSYWEFSVCFWF